jgi:hypothetical protein
MTKAANDRNWLQESRHINRGSAYLFSAKLNVMAEVGETPP